MKLNQSLDDKRKVARLLKQAIREHLSEHRGVNVKVAFKNFKPCTHTEIEQLIGHYKLTIVDTRDRLCDRTIRHSLQVKLTPIIFQDGCAGSIIVPIR